MKCHHTHAMICLLVTCLVGPFLLAGASSRTFATRAHENTNLQHALYLPIALSAQPAPLPLSDATYWAYQIQSLSDPGAVDALVNSHYDMLVLEPTRTDWSSTDKDFDTRGMVSRLKDSLASDGAHRKLVLAYVDIGESEDWRWYWTWSQGWDCTGDPPGDWPDYILACDPDGWAGNYPVAYWDAHWKDVIIYGQNTGSDPDRDYTSAIDEAIVDGFDGIYLDWVEAFENEDVIAAAQAAGKDPATEMIAFIQEMRAYAALRNPDFLIIQQNAAALCDGHPELFTRIDAIAQEAIWYDGDADVDWDDPAGHDFVNAPSLTSYYVGYLDQYLGAGLPVFDCEYALSYASTAYVKSNDRGYVPYTTRRSLSRLTTTPPPGYLGARRSDWQSDLLTSTLYLPIVLNTGDEKWRLWTDSTQLRGANIYQRRVYPELDGATFMGPGPVGPPYTQTDLDNLAALGANYVNISHPGLYAEDPPYTLDTDIQASLDNLLTKIAAADMFAVIAFRTGPGRSEFTFHVEDIGDWFDASYLNDAMWQSQAAQDAWVTMWRYTANRYRDNPVVVGYDLMVEPNSNEVGSHALNDALDIWDPDEFYTQYGGTLYDWNQLYPRITTGIRQVDTQTPILVGGMAYSAVDWLPYLQPTGDPRTVYMVHQYAPTAYTHQEAPLVNTYPGVFDADWDGADDQVNKVWLNDLLSTIDTFKAAHGVPVAVNEFGLMRWEPGAAAFMDDQMDLFEQRGMNHALWLWEVSWEEFAQEVHAFNFRFGPDPSNRADVNSALRGAILKYWSRNVIRPSHAQQRRVVR